MPGFVDVLAERKIEKVMRDTWGHMDALPGVDHPGTILFAESEFGGERMILRADFGEHAGHGPWFYEAVCDWLWDQDTKPGQIYRFEGCYRVVRDHHKFTGTITKLEV